MPYIVISTERSERRDLLRDTFPYQTKDATSIIVILSEGEAEVEKSPFGTVYGLINKEVLYDI